MKAEIKHLLVHKAKRAVPKREHGKLLVATWNLANLGVQERREQDKVLLGEIASWFDVIAVQECRENYGDLYDVLRCLPKSYRVVMSDSAGNDERMVFLYDGRRLKLQEEIGEIALPPSEFHHIHLPNNLEKFDGFDRTPYLATFVVGQTSVTFVNVHLYFGKEGSPKSIARRCLETFAVARWANLRKLSPFSLRAN